MGSTPPRWGGGGAGPVGVGTGDACVEPPVPMVSGRCGWLGVGTVPVYGVPNSPGENASVEQKPSDELITSVKPSLDLELISWWVAWGRAGSLPGEVGKGGKVKVADDAQWHLLLRIIHQHCILGGNRIHYSVGQCECRCRVAGIGIDVRVSR